MSFMGYLWRCQALDGTGRQCRRKKDLEWFEYHGEHELYEVPGNGPAWVKILLCPQHREKPKENTNEKQEI